MIFISKLLEDVSKLEGNYYNGKVYLSPINAQIFADNISSNVMLDDILITPFLIDRDKNTVYELYNYEYAIHISENAEITYTNYSVRNSLPLEIIDNLKPQISIPKGDYTTYVKAIQTYIQVMLNMKFPIERNRMIFHEKSQLYFEIW